MKKKILFLLQLPPPNYGAAIVGQEIRDSKLINRTFDATFLNIILTRSLNSPSAALCRLLRHAALLFRLVWLLGTRHFDLCYVAATCHGVGFLKDSLFVLICKLFRRKVVIHQHNQGMRADAQKPFYRTLYPLVYRKTKVILLSERLYEDVSAHVRREQVLICPNGSPALADPREIPQKTKPHRIVFLSNLFLAKGILTFLDCCKILKERGMAFKADIIGAETAECGAGRLQDEIDIRGLSAETIYHGPKTGADRDSLLSAGTYFLFPTENEAFGLVLVEAMQFRMLCLTTPVGGIPDIIRDGETGFLCDPGNPNVFANKILEMESDSATRDRIAQAAFCSSRTNFTLDRFEKELSRCLNAAMEDNSVEAI